MTIGLAPLQRRPLDALPGGVFTGAGHLEVVGWLDGQLRTSGLCLHGLMIAIGRQYEP